MLNLGMGTVEEERERNVFKYLIKRSIIIGLEHHILEEGIEFIR